MIMISIVLLAYNIILSTLPSHSSSPICSEPHFRSCASHWSCPVRWDPWEWTAQIWWESSISGGWSSCGEWADTSFCSCFSSAGYPLSLQFFIVISLIFVDPCTSSGSLCSSRSCLASDLIGSRWIMFFNCFELVLLSWVLPAWAMAPVWPSARYSVMRGEWRVMVWFWPWAGWSGLERAPGIDLEIAL